MTAPYRRIADELRQRIESGRLGPGDLVPSARQITRDWGVAIATASKALAVLRDEGFTLVRPGVGTVVTTRVPAHGTAPAPRRRTPAPLTRDRVVAAAVGIADREGFDEVSMRRLAAEFDARMTVLHRCVSTEDDLVLHMIDAVFGEVRLPAVPDGQWRERLEASSVLLWQLFRRHPWLAPVLSLTRPQPAPNALRLTAWVLAGLAGTPLGEQERFQVHLLLVSYVRGLATALDQEALARRETGLTEDEWMHAKYTKDVLPAVLAEMDLDLDLDVLFRFGLQRFLDGLATLIGPAR